MAVEECSLLLIVLRVKVTVTSTKLPKQLPLLTVKVIVAAIIR